MAKMNSGFKYMYDAASAVAFRAKDSAALTADGNSTAIVLDQLDGYWNTQGELADQTFAIVINVDALELGDDEEYQINVVWGDDASFTNSVTTHSLYMTETGQYAVLCDIDTVKKLLSGVTRVRLALDVTASTGSPSIEYYAFIAGAIIR